MAKTEIWAIFKVDLGSPRRNWRSEYPLFGGGGISQFILPPKPPWNIFSLYDGRALIECSLKVFGDIRNAEYLIGKEYPNSTIIFYTFEEREVEEKMHDFGWALKQMKAGKKVRRGSWGENCRIGYSSTDPIYIYDYDRFMGWKPLTADLVAENWILFVEGHNWDWALNQMKAGGAARRTAWKKGNPGVKLNDNRFVFTDSYDTFCISPVELNATDWIIH